MVEGKEKVSRQISGNLDAKDLCLFIASSGVLLTEQNVLIF